MVILFRSGTYVKAPLCFCYSDFSFDNKGKESLLEIDAVTMDIVNFFAHQQRARAPSSLKSLQDVVCARSTSSHMLHNQR